MHKLYKDIYGLGSVRKKLDIRILNGFGSFRFVVCLVCAETHSVVLEVKNGYEFQRGSVYTGL